MGAERAEPVRAHTRAGEPDSNKTSVDLACVSPDTKG